MCKWPHFAVTTALNARVKALSCKKVMGLLEDLLALEQDRYFLIEIITAFPRKYLYRGRPLYRLCSYQSTLGSANVEINKENV